MEQKGTYVSEFNPHAGEPYNPAMAFDNIMEVFDNITHAGLSGEDAMEQLRVEITNALGLKEGILTLDQVAEALVTANQNVFDDTVEAGRQRQVLEALDISSNI